MAEIAEIPEDIPADVWAYAEAVEKVWRDLPPRQAIESHARAILAERLAERERAAKIAEELWKVRAASNLSPTEAARLTAQSIASSIRSQSLSDKE